MKQECNHGQRRRSNLDFRQKRGSKRTVIHSRDAGKINEGKRKERKKKHKQNTATDGSRGQCRQLSNELRRETERAKESEVDRTMPGIK